MDLVNQHIACLYHPVGDTIKAYYELGVAKKSGLFRTEGWRSRKDQTTCWCELTYISLYDETNQFLGYSCTLADRSTQQQTEQQLRQQEERYRLMVEGVIDYAIFMLDTGGYIQTWNEGTQRIKGYASPEIIGKHFSSFYTAEDPADDKPARELRIAIQTGKYEEEGWRVKKNGSVFWANMVITALFNEQNQHIGFSNVTRDLTERKRAEEALRESYDRYRSLSIELQRSNEDLQRFAHVASYDLKEPVRKVKLFSHQLAEEYSFSLPGKGSLFLAKIEQSADRMFSMIQGILSYSSLNGLSQAFERIDLNRLLDQIEEDLELILLDKQARINRQQLTWLDGVPILLYQLFSNLTNNSLKFAKETEPPLIRISSSLEADTNRLIIQVTDNGIGFEQYYAEHVFQPFTRLHAKDMYKGTGL